MFLILPKAYLKSSSASPPPKKNNNKINGPVFSPFTFMVLPSLLQFYDSLRSLRVKREAWKLTLTLGYIAKMTK